MVKSQLKLAWRVLVKQKLYSSLNIAGLAIGLATTMLLLLWVNDELGYDRFHPKHGQIIKLMLNIASDSQETQTYGWVATPVADAMKREIPGVLQTTCFLEQKAIFNHLDKTTEETGLVVDTDFLKVFRFPLLHGNPSALLSTNAILITKKLAEKYFGAENAIGKIIRLDQTQDVEVAGVLEDVPGNSTIQFDYLRPMSTPAAAGSWLEIKAQVFAVVDPKIHFGQFTSQLKTLTSRHMPEWVTGWTYISHRLDDVYLNSNFKNGQNEGGGRMVYVRLFGFVAAFVLLIAAINFINLSTARAAVRAKEVGVRKAVGAGRWSLVRQFLSESLLMTIIAGTIGLILTLATLPVFNELLQKRIQIDWTNPVYWVSYLGILLLTGILAGLYPAFVLSGFRPVKVLTGMRTNAAGGAVWLRKTLVIVQFTVTSVLLVGTGIVFQQIDFIRNRNLGYQKQNLIRFNAKGLSGPEQYEHAKSVLENVNGVESVTFSNSSFQGTFGRNYVEWGGQQTTEKAMFAVINGDANLISTLNMRLHSGRTFSRDFGADSIAVIINETAAKRMKLKDALGERIRVNGREHQVIGVVKDFHIASVHQSIEPSVIIYSTAKINFLFARLNAKNQGNTLKEIEARYQQLMPGIPFNFQFLDREYEHVYYSELQIGKLAKWFSVIAVLISCLGLFGLVSFSVERRTREIAIRKILGATVVNIFMLVTREFVLLVCIALIVAALPVWYLMTGWLEKFAYHVEIGGDIFIRVALLSIGITVLTVSSQSIRAALFNPAKSLRAD
ncbi:ABC transporter permease [Dyadobacter crusticola]|uniref:ABC transporter permease n=1 Tax=Dyadobacter crusticola TaxID=292407 RepID=UPI0004E1EE93|nr:ABC transporter permease [Dyadobacter crusticola]